MLPMQLIPLEQVVAAYRYGSKVYGVFAKDSDDDYILVTKDNPPSDHITLGKDDFNFYSLPHFESLIRAHEISALECIFLPEKHILIAHDFDFHLSLPELRKSISAKVSNSWVKAKKKFADRQLHIARKSLWHCFRMLDFGCQIARFGRILDFTSSNNLWYEIVLDEHDNWEYFKEKYQARLNEASSEFRKLAPK